MKQLLFFTLFYFTSLAAQPAPSGEQQVAVKNRILAKVNGETISVLDVKKKMDLFLHKNYAHLEESNEAKYQFYETHWQNVLKELIDHELLLADALEKQIPLSDGDVREEIGNRFGPNIMRTLDKLGLTYDETFKMVKDDLLVQRMTWWFIHSKAINQVTPQDIRQAFQSYVKEHPATTEWTYQVIVIRGKNPEVAAEKIHHLLQTAGKCPEDLLTEIQKIESAAQISSEFSTLDSQLSQSHKAALDSLCIGQFGKPTLQKSKKNAEEVARIFYLKDKKLHPAPQFEEMAQGLKNELIQKAVAQESTQYLNRLRKNFTFHLEVPEDFHPFSLK